jgi:hypothetical protein
VSNKEIAPTLVDGELRILDVNLAERLGFAKPTKIRDLVKRHLPSLETMGTVPTVGTVVRGQKTTEFYLNRKQAIFITAKSETPTATDITIEIIHRFDEYEQGRIASPKSEPVFRAKPYEEWSEEEIRLNIAEVRLYRRIMSTAAAFWKMRQAGFPMPPDQLLPAWQRQDGGLFGQNLTVNILNGKVA